MKYLPSIFQFLQRLPLSTYSQIFKIAHANSDKDMKNKVKNGLLLRYIFRLLTFIMLE
jgi:hypothetical protein